MSHRLTSETTRWAGGQYRIACDNCGQWVGLDAVIEQGECPNCDIDLPVMADWLEPSNEKSAAHPPTEASR